MLHHCRKYDSNYAAGGGRNYSVGKRDTGSNSNHNTPVKKLFNRQYAPVYLTGIALQLTHTISCLKLITTVVMSRSKRYTEKKLAAIN
mmetsp:Transcript_35591/g.41205  ORF Transcript_35591/g.41205 Transcript_35591/m.41205 type:complete len:88 (+) Transcript_35591:21-284(+)